MAVYAVTYRPATPFDAARIAELHARSWQQNYRGSMSDDFLDRDVDADRLAVWTDRFSAPDERLRVMVAESGRRLVGFCCLLLDYHSDDGALLDNLHIRKGYQGKGIGKHLIRWAAVTTLAHDPSGRLYLWVLNRNVAAKEMYTHLGGRIGRTEMHHLESGYDGGLEATCVHFAAESLV